MSRATQNGVAALLALAIAALPVVLDRCAESCEAHQHGVASAPACHHAAAGGTHISQAPGPCGHDHNGTTVTAATSAASTGRVFSSAVSVDTQPTVAPPTAADLRFLPHSPPDSTPALHSRSLPLRV